jgi:hypothetical protein
MYVGTGAQATVTSLLGVYSNGYAYTFGAAAIASFISGQTFNTLGNASTATSTTLLAALGAYVWNNANAPSTYALGIQNSFVSAAEGFPSYGSVMTMRTYSGGGGGVLQLYAPYGSSYGGTALRFRTGDYSASGEPFNAWKIILDDTNYNSYAVAYRIQSNWNNSTSVINNVVGQLAWKNYGNNHTIFDASAGTAPDGTAISNINPNVSWIATYPILMGWNGSSTYGVRVDSARIADSATLAPAYLPLSGGTLTGALIGTSATFSGTLSASNLSGTNTGDQTNISGTAGSETLATVVSRGSSTSATIITGAWTPYGVGGDSGQPTPSTDYRIYQSPGPWIYPFPDLNIAYHTGIKIGAYYSYGGTRFYNNSDMATELFSVGNGDNHVRVAYNLSVTGTATAAGGGFDSDLTLKDIVTRDLSNYQISNKISTFKYKWKDQTKSQVERFGYGAQELLEIIPEAVYKSGETYAVDYTQVHTVLIDENIRRIKELEKEVEELKKRLL